MPDAGGALGAADRLPTDPADANPDRIGEELADDAHIWRVYDRVAKEDDDRRIASWNRGLDNLALFAGLFSAVTTAFIIEGQADMKPDYSQLIFQSLNATAFDQRFVPEPFVIPSGARVVNGLWISSLVLSLSAALIAIMGKDWIGMYSSRPVCNARQWAEMRTYRLRCVEQWYMSGVIATAPVLLHVSLILFGAGLVGFNASDPLAHHLLLTLCLFVGFLYVVTTLSGVIFPASPFKSPATQMIRAALPQFVLYLRITLSSSKRNVLASLQRAINEIVAPGLHTNIFRHHLGLRDDLATVDAALPLRTDPPRFWSLSVTLRSLRRAAALLSLSVADLPGKLVDAIRCVPKRLKAFAFSLYHSIIASHIFSGSTWTEPSVDRRPELLAHSLSWLDSASHQPNVLRSLLFAIGDLEIGYHVGQLVSLDLRVRIRAEIRHTWHKAGYLMLSRYVLADRNLAQDPVLALGQFVDRFDLVKDPSLRCEHGLATYLLTTRTSFSPRSLAECCPDRISQPRMLHFLLPRIAHLGKYSVECFIIIARRYWVYLWRDPSFRLEAELFKFLEHSERKEYAEHVKSAYGGRNGPIELLTFLCIHRDHERVVQFETQLAAVDLIFQILESTPHERGPHECLAYLFGERNYESTWYRRDWSEDRMYLLFECLEPALRSVCDGTSSALPLFTLPNGFAFVLARTAVMFISPAWDIFDRESLCARYLVVQLCSPLSRLDDYCRTDVVKLLLDHSALATLLSSRIGLSDRIRHGVAILGAAATHVARQLETLSIGYYTSQRLFRKLGFSETKDVDGKMVSWDLGSWLKDTAPDVLRKFPSTGGAMQEFHDAMVAIRPRRALSEDMRAYWGRIGYPGLPGDIVRALKAAGET